MTDHSLIPYIVSSSFASGSNLQYHEERVVRAMSSLLCDLYTLVGACGNMLHFTNC